MQRILSVVLLVLVTVFGFAVYLRSRSNSSGTSTLSQSGDRELATSKQDAAILDRRDDLTSPHTSAAQAKIPRDMVLVPGGEFWMGSSEPMFPDAHPWHRVYLGSFYIDQTLVTNDAFASFVSATGYLTTAEQAPRPEEFPGAPPENLVAGSVVFSPPGHPVPLNDHLQWWSYVKGANWRHPQGPNSDLRHKGRHPVVHVAYRDAESYCQWQGKRLPTEAEYEYAARGGLDRKTYAWGNEFKPRGKFMANTFQGHFPDKNTAEDGYVTTSPVASFPANGYGLYDMSGNVWEWTSDWYRPDYYAKLAASGEVTRNPRGPADSYDPGEPGVAKKVQRGGSFLCTDQYCSRYMVGGRGKGEPDTGTNHLGFRCVKAAGSSSTTTANIQLPVREQK